MKRPKPSIMRSAPQSVERHVFCRHYDECLDRALVRGWSGFSCSSCSGLDMPRMDPEAWLEDALRCAEVIHEVFKEEPDPLPRLMAKKLERAQDMEPCQDTTPSRKRPPVGNWLLLPAEAAIILGLSEVEVLQLCQAGALSSLRLGPRTIRLKAESVMELAARIDKQEG